MHVGYFPVHSPVHSAALALAKRVASDFSAWNIPSSKTLSAQNEPFLARLEKTDPEKAAALRKEQNQIEELLRQLRSSQKSASERRKDAARKKVERLKNEIAALRMMTSGDPEAIARQVARLARELASAAKEYASVGGDLSIMANTATTTAAPPSSKSSQTPQAPQSDTTKPTPPPLSTSAAEDSKAAFLERIDHQVTKTNQHARDTEEDQMFVQTVRRLINELKAILQKADQKMQREDEDSTHRDVIKTQDALRDTEQSLSGISAMALTTALSLNITI